LIEAGRKAFRPTSADRERVLQALRARIPAEGGNLGGPTAPAAAPAVKGIAWLGASAAAGLAVVAAVILSRPAAETQVPSAASAARPSPVAHELTLAPGSALPEQAPAPTDSGATTSAPTPSSARPSSARHASDRLKEEVAILSRAESERHARRFASALNLLEEHRRKFPRGSLSQERMAARIRVLCGLGRVTEAEAELAALKRASPSSLHLPARAACAAK
jgi:hypothetical protein